MNMFKELKRTDLIDRSLSAEAADLDNMKRDVKDLCGRFPIYEGLLEDIAAASPPDG